MSESNSVKGILKNVFAKVVGFVRDNVFIFDLDGTLVDISHRMHLYDQGEWDEFNRRCVDDIPLPTTILMAKLLSQHFAIEVWTARNENARADTIAQLAALGIDYVHLQMRPTGNAVPDAELKRGWYQSRKADNPNFNVMGVYEDRDSVVQMWRDLGLTCYQVAPGDF